MLILVLLRYFWRIGDFLAGLATLLDEPFDKEEFGVTSLRLRLRRVMGTASFQRASEGSGCPSVGEV